MKAYTATNVQRPKDGLYLLGKNKHKFVCPSGFWQYPCVHNLN